MNGTCIICRKTNVELTDEHVIPDAIGGHYHIQHVCKNCNSMLGSEVDKLLVQSDLISLIRFSKSQAGKTGKIPNPFIGKHTGDDGLEYYVDYRQKQFNLHLIPKTEISDNGCKIRVVVDPSQQSNIDNKVNNLLLQNGIDPQNVKIERTTEHITVKPWIQYQLNVDLHDYMLVLLKMVYEFAVHQIPNYFEDATAVLISDILLSHDPKRLSEVTILGDGFTDYLKPIYERYLDYGKDDRHYLFLQTISGKLYGFVKLYNLYFLGFQLSANPYIDEVGDGIVLINDMTAKNRTITTFSELLSKATTYTTGYRIADEFNAWMQTCLANGIQIGFVCDKDSHNLLFRPDTGNVTTDVLLMQSLPDSEVSVSLKDQQVEIIYNIPEGHYLLVKPFNVLIPLRQIVSTGEIRKQ